MWSLKRGRKEGINIGSYVGEMDDRRKKEMKDEEHKRERNEERKDKRRIEQKDRR